MLADLKIIDHIEFEDNPCFGCTSAACSTCPCAGENETQDLSMLRAPQERKKRAARKKAEVKPQRDAFLVALDQVKKYVSLPAPLFDDVKRPFVLRADGDGMKNAGILTGDQIIFEERSDPSNGDIVVGRFNGILLCRRIFFEESGIRVRREDGETPDTVTADYTIFGIMVGLMRSCRKAG